MRIVAIDPGTERSALVTVDVELGYGWPVPSPGTRVILKNDHIRAALTGSYMEYADLATGRMWKQEWGGMRSPRPSGGEPHCVIEMISSYGMRVGREVFETCVWIGRFMDAWGDNQHTNANRITRSEVKMELCNTNRANDADVRAALIDLYGPGKAAAIGLKKTPGPLYGFKKDMWAALGVAVTYARRLERDCKS